MSDYWTDEQAEKVQAYLQTIQPELYSIEDSALLAKLLIRQHLPADVLIHELWWIAAGVIHPHCRGSWLALPKL